MGLISNKTLEEVNEISILRVVETYYKPLKKKGQNNWWAKSPFNPKEKTASFSVVPSKGIFKCFSTGIGGKSIKFVQEFHNWDWRTAVLDMCDKFSIVPEFEGEEKEDPNDIGYSMNWEAMTMWHQNFLVDDEAMMWMIDRGFHLNAIEHFKIGVCRGNLPMNYTEAELLKFGLIRKGKSGTYIPFQNRIVFPIRDQRGRVTGFTARAFGDQKPKYINTPETSIFKKSEQLYGLFENQGSIRKKNSFLLAEGTTDVMMAWQTGIKTAIAPLGTSLSGFQVKTLYKFAESCFISTDGDPAGVNATFKWSAEFLSENFKTKVIALPDGKDLDSICKEENYKELLKSKVMDLTQFAFYQWEAACKKEDEARANQIIKMFCEAFALAYNETQARIEIQKFARLTGLDPQKFPFFKGNNVTDESVGPEDTGPKVFQFEEDLLRYLIHYSQQETVFLAIQTWLKWETPYMLSSKEHDKIFEFLFYETDLTEEQILENGCGELYTKLVAQDPPKLDWDSLQATCQVCFEQIGRFEIDRIKSNLIHEEREVESKVLAQKLNRIYDALRQD